MPVAIVVAVVLLAPVADAWAQPQPRVLTLYTMRPDARLVAIGERELPRILATAGPDGVDYYTEFIDLARLAPELEIFRDYLRRKYRAQAFDLVIAMDAGALDFLATHRADLFPTVPVVFFSSRPSPPRLPNSTGVNAVINLRDTVALAAALQPDLRHIFVVTGTDRSYETLARTELQPYASRFTIAYLAALPTEVLERRIATLPDGSMVFYVHVTADGAGARFNAFEYVERIAAMANAPVYSWVDSMIGGGVVGGSVRNLQGQMEAVGALALRVLAGEPADTIPIAQPDLNVPHVDWRQMHRWGLSEQRLPAGTIVSFREPSAWQRYGAYIVGAGVLLIAQAVVIVTLLGHRRRSRRAADGIRDLGARLLHAQEAERSRIARELHDDVSQQLALLALDLDQVGAPGARERTQAIARTVHDLWHRLHPDKARLLGLTAAIQGLQRELSRPGTEIVVTQDDMPAAVPGHVAVGVYRVAEEALRNAIAHAGAGRVTLHLRGAPAHLALTVTDDGAGFDVDEAWRRGIGLISMRERIQAMGGTFAVESSPGAGTRLSVTVPIDESATRWRDHARAAAR